MDEQWRVLLGAHLGLRDQGIIMREQLAALSDAARMAGGYHPHLHALQNALMADYRWRLATHRACLQEARTVLEDRRAHLAAAPTSS